MTWDGEEYQRRFDALAAAGRDVHGEAALVRSYHPRTVLDAGCGTGRVALELARHAIEVVGVDVDPSMLATAERAGPGTTWLREDLATLDLGRRFDVVVMAGNVLVFTTPGTEAQVVAACARHLEPPGVLLTGFQLDRGYALDTFDDHCAAAGLVLVDRWSTWARDRFVTGGAYAVSAHRLAG